MPRISVEELETVRNHIAAAEMALTPTEHNEQARIRLDQAFQLITRIIADALYVKGAKSA